MVFIQIWSLECSREKKLIYPIPIEMSFKQKIQSMSGSLFQNCTWLLIKRLDKDVTGGIPVV